MLVHYSLFRHPLVVTTATAILPEVHRKIWWDFPSRSAVSETLRAPSGSVNHVTFLPHSDDWFELKSS